jgi:hypothetical protein
MKIIAKELKSANDSGTSKSLAYKRHVILAIAKIIKLIEVATIRGAIREVEDTQISIHDKPNSSLSLGFTSLMALV